MSLAMSIGGMVSLFCMIWVIYEVWAVNTRVQTGGKILWTVGAIFFNIITAILYYFIEKRAA